MAAKKEKRMRRNSMIMTIIVLGDEGGWERRKAVKKKSLGKWERSYSKKNYCREANLISQRQNFITI